jgi:hypothetical protein
MGSRTRGKAKLRINGCCARRKPREKRKAHRQHLKKAHQKEKEKGGHDEERPVKVAYVLKAIVCPFRKG